MPIISDFKGIVIQMYPKDHLPPHFHARYSGQSGIFDIKSGEMIKGGIPERQARYIRVWAEFHQEELLANWELAPFKTEPLR